MNKSRLFVGLLLVALAVMLTPASHAQAATNCQSPGYVNGNGVAVNCNVIAVGSSAIFPSAALAAVTGDPQRGVQTPLCGSNFWTGSAFGRDARKTITNPNLVDEPGTVWVAWDDSTNPTIICLYLSVDSIVGQRLFYGQGSGASGPTNNGQLIFYVPGAGGEGSDPCTTNGADKVAFIWDTGLPTPGPLPSAIYNALQGTTGTTCPTPALPVNFTTASTDVSPADAKFVGNDRALSGDGNATADFPTDSKIGLGYGGSTCLVPGPAVASSYETSTIANSVCYTFVGGQPDPISGTAIPNSQIVSEGALAMLPLIGITNTNSGGFGDLFNNRGFNDVLSHDLAAGYAKSTYGTAATTRSLYLGRNNVNGVSIPVAVVHYLAREPQSGTYTTWEWQVVRNKESALGGGGLSQETNLCGPTQGAGCPYNTPANNAAACPSQASNLSNITFPQTLSCSNYASWGANGINALKTRVLGTGEMVKVLNANAASAPMASSCVGSTFPGTIGTCITDTFGYAFWSLGTFGGKGHVVYLQLDSNDALYQGWSTTDGGNNGFFPTVPAAQLTTPPSPTPGSPVGAGCSGYFNGNGTTITNFTCNASWPYPTFANIVSGNYRSWSINRVVWYLPAGTTSLAPKYLTTTLNPPGFWQSAADQTAPTIGSPAHGLLPDFMPFGYCANAAACPEGVAPTLTYPLNTFRSHYSLPSWGLAATSNGITAGGFGGVEVGGDVAGDAITVQAEADSLNFFSASFLSWLQ